MKAMLLHNPSSGQKDRAGEIEGAADRLTQAGWTVDLVTSTDVKEIEQLARSAVVTGLDTLVMAGGDGTLNLGIQSLAHRGTALGVIPVGTTNVWAREMGIPLDVAAATDVLISGRSAQVDLGQANGRYFLFVASAGFDASVTRGVDPRAKRRLGVIAYIGSAIVEAFKLRGVDTTIISEGGITRQRVLMVVANNTRLYGGVLKMAPEALADDGLLDVSVFPGRGLLEGSYHLFKVLLGRHTHDSRVRSFKSSTLTIAARNGLPVQLDGDYFGTTPVTFRAVPGALKVVLPPGPHPQLGQLKDGG